MKKKILILASAAACVALAGLRRMMAGQSLVSWQKRYVEPFLERLASLPLLSADHAALERDLMQPARQIVIHHPTLGDFNKEDLELLSVGDDRGRIEEEVRRIAGAGAVGVSPPQPATRVPHGIVAVPGCAESESGPRRGARGAGPPPPHGGFAAGQFNARPVAGRYPRTQRQASPLAGALIFKVGTCSCRAEGWAKADAGDL